MQIDRIGAKGEKCRICGHEPSNHPECDACRILVGPNHVEQFLVPFMKHHICIGCDSSTIRKLLADSWEGFLKGIPLKRTAEYRRQKERVKYIDGEAMRSIRSIN